MIANLKPYPAMKYSGVTCLGEVPEHWEVSALRRKLRTYDGIKIGPFGSQLKLEQMSPSGYKVYGQANVIARDFARGTKFVDQEKFNELSACEVLPSDLLVTMMGTSGRCAYVPDDASEGIMDSHLLRLRTDFSINVRFASRIIDESPYVKEQISVTGKGSIMHGLNSGIVKALVLALPPLPEQAAIVRFLDHADRRIRRYIRAKQKLIKLLEEQKQAIIHQAVTGRIDVRTGQPYPAYKPSGVEWLGEIPGHWEVRRLKSLVRCIDQGVSPQADNYLADGNAWGVLKAGCVNGGVFREREHKRLAFDFVFDPVLAVSPGDVLVSRASGSAHLVGSAGRVSALRYRLILSDKTFRLIFKQEVDPDFMVLAMNGHYYRQQVEQAISGAEGLANNLPLSSLRAFHFVVPNIDEQRNVVAYVRTVADKLGAAASRAWREASLVDEYRTRLIADVVTGKLDVREAAAGLPEVDPLADEFDALTTQATETGMLELEDATETPEELAMENEVII